MRFKILTVDDSKTVRIIVRKAFKGYDCDIIEAGNGVEGLAMAAKELPDLILLDVTMPVMDGVEMLTKLKGEPALRAIPVMMLTAEGGRDNVLKIAKIGIRDYLVKPFKEEALIEKTGRIIDLKPVADGTAAKAKTIFDPADILVVEDKPAIVQQIVEGLRHMPWKVAGVATQGEAIDACAKSPPDLIIISLTLPEDSAHIFFKYVRANPKTKHVPVFGLVVKTEVEQQQAAQNLGFTAVVTKPIDLGELEGRMAKAMNLDTSQRYFAVEGDALIMRLPENCPPTVLSEAAGYMKPKFADAVDAGLSKVLVDIRPLKALHTGVIKHLFSAMQMCGELGMQVAVVGNAQVIAECRGFEDTRGWAFTESLEDARASFGKVTQPAQLAGT